MKKGFDVHDFNYLWDLALAGLKRNQNVSLHNRMKILEFLDYLETQEVGLPRCIRYLLNLGKFAAMIQTDFEKATRYVHLSGRDVDSALLRVHGLQESGKTVILVGRPLPKETIGVIALADNIRPETIKAIKELTRLKVETVIRSGDNEFTAKSIAGKIGASHFHAQLLPQDKVDEVEALTRKYKYVAMVRDGLNDAPALAKASVGVAMGAIGTDVALDTAGVALMKNDVSKVGYLVQLGRRTMRVVQQNIWASILVKGGFAVLAIVGLVSLWMAVAVGEMGLSLAVILNAMRLALIRPKF